MKALNLKRKQNKTELTVEQKKQLSKEVRAFKVNEFYNLEEVFARNCETKAYIGKLKEQYC